MFPPNNKQATLTLICLFCPSLYLALFPATRSFPHPVFRSAIPFSSRGLLVESLSFSRLSSLTSSIGETRETSLPRSKPRERKPVSPDKNWVTFFEKLLGIMSLIVFFCSLKITHRYLLRRARAKMCVHNIAIDTVRTVRGETYTCATKLAGIETLASANSVIATVRSTRKNRHKSGK